MALSAVSLRNNAQCCKPRKNNEINFGHKHKSKEKKSHKGLYITAGMLVAAAALAFAFKKNIANSKIVHNTAAKIKTASEPLTNKLNGIVKKGKSFVTEALNKTPKFTKEESEIITKFKKTGGNQQGVFDTLKKYGMKDSEETYIKETLTLLKEKFAKSNKNTKVKPVSLRTFVNNALKKESPQEIITELLNNSKTIRKTWSL